jgi:hypothetical protein
VYVILVDKNCTVELGAQVLDVCKHMCISWLRFVTLAHPVRNRREPLTATCGLDNLLMTSLIVSASVRGTYICVWQIITVRCGTAISTGIVRGLQEVHIYSISQAFFFYLHSH